MRKTNLRTKAMHDQYEKATKDPDFFETAPSIEEYVHWRIIENIYPYDAIASTHHMLIPKRKVQHLTEITMEEHVELSLLENFKLVDKYDFISRNFPASQSCPDRVHFHLLVLKLL